MKTQLILTTVIYFLYVGLFFGIFVGTIASQENYYKISIADKSYEIYEISERNAQTIIYYDLSIILKNSGNLNSDDVTLEIIGDDELPLYVNDTIPPGGVREFKWENKDFFLVGPWDHYINISYYPTDPTIGRNENNSGEDSLILKYNEASGNGDTPGFEAVFLLVIIALYVAVKKYKK